MCGNPVSLTLRTSGIKHTHQKVLITYITLYITLYDIHTPVTNSPLTVFRHTNCILQDTYRIQEID